MLKLDYLKKKLIGAIIYNNSMPDNPKWIISDVEEGEYFNRADGYILTLVYGSIIKTYSTDKYRLLNFMTDNDRTIKIEFMNEEEEEQK